VNRDLDVALASRGKIYLKLDPGGSAVKMWISMFQCGRIGAGWQVSYFVPVTP
jgi:hypothetical protein